MKQFVRVNSVRVPVETILASNCRTTLEYWNLRRGERFAPTWREFDLPDLPAEVIRFTHVVDVNRDPFDLTFRFWGTGLTDVLFFDRTGQSLSVTNMGYLDEDRRRQVMEDYQAVIESRDILPFLWDASSTREHAATLVVPSLRLPLSDDGERVTHIVTHFDFAGNRAEWERIFEVHKRPL